MARVSGKYKPLFFVSIVLLLFTLRPHLCAAATTPDGFEYTTSGSEATITGYSGPGGDITIPGTINDGINDYTVTTIGSYAFYNIDTLTNVFFASNISSIENWAFSYCHSLTNIQFGSNLTSIGAYAFCGCNSLSRLDIPASTISIGEAAFDGCTGLTSLTFPNSITDFGGGIFANCTSLTSVVIPDGLTTIPGGMFSWCSNLSSVSIPDSVTSIDGGAFVACSSLDSLILPGNLRTISGYAFSGCNSLSNIDMPGNLVTIGEFAFQGCNMSVIDIPDTVNSIGSGAFGYCNNLTSISLGSGIDSLSVLMFQGCSNLTGITIPGNISNIGNGAFKDCTGLTEVTIPNSVETIGPEAFKSCHSLTSITIPDSITSIDNFVFQNCTGLQSVSIPTGVSEIGGNSFEGCSSLESITFPDSVTSIGDAAFCDCTSLSEARFLGDAPALGNIAFENCAASFTVLCLAEKSGFSQLWYGYPTATFEGETRSLAITDCLPMANDIAVPISQVITITFDRDVTAAENYNEVVLTDGDGSTVEIVKTLAGNVLQLDPVSDLTNGVTYSVSIPSNCVIGVDGTPLVLPFNLGFTVVIPLEVTATVPSSNEQGVPVGQTIFITFSTVITEGFNFYDVLLKDMNNSAVTSYRYTSDNNLVIDPVWDLQEGMTYTVLVPAGSIISQSGIPLESDIIFNFTVISEVETPLEVTATDPFEGETHVSVGANISVDFNQIIVPSDQYDDISLQPDSGDIVAIDKSISANKLVIDPLSDLNPGITYSLIIPVDAIQAINGLQLQTLCEFSFTTASRALEVISTDPLPYASDIPEDKIITVTFAEDIAEGSNWDAIIVRDNQWNFIPISKSINASVLTIQPESALTREMIYTVSLPEDSIVGLSGPSLTSPYNFDFTTIPRIESDFYDITTDRSNATITGYSGPGGEITIPDQITKDGKTYNVTGIAGESFGWRDDITIINIPASVTNIDVWAFNMSVNLAELNVSSGNKKYSSVDGVLYYRGKDTLVCYPPGGPDSFAIPNYVKTIGDSAFTFMGPRLYEITIPNSVKTIGNHAFENNAISEVIIPSSVTSIGDNAFANCGSLTEVTIGKGVTRIGDYAFASCSSLGGIIIPDSVTKLGIWAFADCYSLQSVKIGNGIKSIGECTFQFCSSLETVVLGKSVTSIGPWAFIGCSSLNSINFPNGLTSIGEAPFEDCTSLTSLEFPNSLSSIGIYAFNRCSGLESVTIPKNITSLSEGIFQGCSGLTNVTIPKGVTDIGSYAFYTCSGLEEAKFLGSAPTMGDQVFDECSPDFKVYYIAGSTGYTDPWYGYPTETVGK